MNIPDEFDDYRLEKKIGQGGMGLIYLAIQKSLGRQVAIKFLPHTYDEKLRERFFLEAKMSAQINHPNVVQIYTYGVIEDSPYFVMEFVDGVTANRYIEQYTKFSFSRSLDVMSQVAEALEGAHELNIIHRDIKPSNIMITRKGLVKVMDFGLAKAKSILTNLTQSGTVLGTPNYMAPEQIRGDDQIDGRADIYSFGVVFYEMVTGHLPFAGDNPQTIFYKHLQETPPNPLEYTPNLPQALVDVIVKCLEKDPRDRYQKTSLLLNDLRTLPELGEKPLSNHNVSQMGTFSSIPAPRPPRQDSSPPPKTLASPSSRPKTPSDIDRERDAILGQMPSDSKESLPAGSESEIEEVAPLSDLFSPSQLGGEKSDSSQGKGRKDPSLQVSDLFGEEESSPEGPQPKTPSSQGLPQPESALFGDGDPSSSSEEERTIGSPGDESISGIDFFADEEASPGGDSSAQPTIPSKKAKTPSSGKSSNRNSSSPTAADSTEKSSSRQLYKEFELTERQYDLLDYLEDRERITSSEWADFVGVSSTTALKDIQGLVEIGILIQKGQGRNTHYVKNLTLETASSSAFRRPPSSQMESPSQEKGPILAPGRENQPPSFVIDFEDHDDDEEEEGGSGRGEMEFSLDEGIGTIEEESDEISLEEALKNKLTSEGDSLRARARKARELEGDEGDSKATGAGPAREGERRKKEKNTEETGPPPSLEESDLEDLQGEEKKGNQWIIFFLLLAAGVAAILYFGLT